MKHDVKLLAGKGTIIEIDGVKYAMGKSKHCMKDGVKHLKYIEFDEINLDERDEILKKLGEQLAHTVPPQRVIEELFKKEDVKDLKKLLKKLESGEVTAKTTDGCLGITMKNIKKNKSQFHSIFG